MASVRKPKDVPKPRKAAGAIRAKLKKVKPFDVQTVFEESLAAEDAQIAARVALSSIIDRGADILFQHHIQRLAIEHTAANTISNAFDALQLRLLKHDAGELDGIFPTASSSVSIANVPESSASSTSSARPEELPDLLHSPEELLQGQDPPIAPINFGNPTLEKLRALRERWGDVSDSDEEDASRRVVDNEVENEDANESDDGVLPRFSSYKDASPSPSAVRDSDWTLADPLYMQELQQQQQQRRQQLWACEPVPVPCEEDRWSRGLAPVTDRDVIQSSKHHLPLNPKFVATLPQAAASLAQRERDAVAAAAAASANSAVSSSSPVLPVSSSLFSNSPSTPVHSLRRPSAVIMTVGGGIGGDGPYTPSPAAASTPSITSSPSSRTHMRTSSGTFQGGQQSAAAAVDAPEQQHRAMAAVSAAREQVMRGSNLIDLRSLPSESPLYSQSSANASGSGANVLGLGSATSGAASPRPGSASRNSFRTAANGGAHSSSSTHAAGANNSTNNGSGSSVQHVPVPAHLEKSAHKLEEERLRAVELKNLTRQKKLDAQNAEMLQRVAAEDARVERLRAELKGKEYTFARDGRVILVKPPAPESLSATIVTPTFTVKGGAGASTGTGPRDGQRGRGQAGAGAGAGTGTGAAGRPRLGAGAQGPAQTKDGTGSSAYGVTAMVVDSGLVQPPLSQTLHPAAGVTLKQGTVTKAGPKRQTAAQETSAASSSSSQLAGAAAAAAVGKKPSTPSPSPYATMNKEQYTAFIQQAAPTAPPVVPSALLSSSPTSSSASTSLGKTGQPAASAQGSVTSSSFSSLPQSAAVKAPQPASSSTASSVPSKLVPNIPLSVAQAASEGVGGLSGDPFDVPGASLGSPRLRFTAVLSYAPDGRQLQASGSDRARAVGTSSSSSSSLSMFTLEAQPRSHSPKSKARTTASAPHPSPHDVFDALQKEPGRGIVPYGKRPEHRPRDRNPKLEGDVDKTMSAGSRPPRPFALTAALTLSGSIPPLPSLTGTSTATAGSSAPLASHGHGRNPFSPVEGPQVFPTKLAQYYFQRKVSSDGGDGLNGGAPA